MESSPQSSQVSRSNRSGMPREPLTNPIPSPGTSSGRKPRPQSLVTRTSDSARGRVDIDKSSSVPLKGSFCGSVASATTSTVSPFACRIVDSTSVGWQASPDPS